MADTASKGPEIQSLTPRGINLRADKNATPNGFCDREHGMWPKRTGSRSRLPGKTLLRKVSGEVTYLRQVFGTIPRIVGQIGSTLQSFTLDELLNRAETPDLEAAVGNEEDQVGVAIITQTQLNLTVGGSIDGFMSGVSAATADTFYGRRLTNMWVNETVNTLQTVDTFTASTGGGGVASTAGQFILVPGTYRIVGWFSYDLSTFSQSVVFGLYNATDAVFESYSGTTEPIIGSAVSTSAQYAQGGFLNCGITVSGSNKTFEIRQKATPSGLAQSLTCCGINTGMTGANVNAAAAKNTYAIIKIWRFT